MEDGLSVDDEFNPDGPRRQETKYEIKDSGERASFAGGMVRDTAEGKTDFTSLLFGPMLKRWAAHLTKGRIKYPDPEPGVPNWTLAEGRAEWVRARESLMRHFFQYLDGDQDEDHAAAIFFNINLMEYTLDRAGRVGNWKLVGDKRDGPRVTYPPGTIIEYPATSGHCKWAVSQGVGQPYKACVLPNGHPGAHQA